MERFTLQHWFMDICSHTNTSPCASGVERDSQDTSEEPHWKHDTQDTHPGETPSGRAVAMGYPSQPDRSRVSLSSIHQTCNGYEEREEVDGERE